MVINSKLVVTIGDTWLMDRFSVYENASQRYGDFLLAVEYDEIKEWYICQNLLAATGADEIYFEVVRGDKVRFDIEHFETIPGNYFGRPEDCYPCEDSFLQQETLENDELRDMFRDFVLDFEIEE